MVSDKHSVLKHNLFIDIIFSHLLFSKIDSGWLIIYREGTLEVNLHSQGTKLGDMLTLAPERYTAGLCMVTKVIPISETTV